jgi:hypothetical protein
MTLHTTFENKHTYAAAAPHRLDLEDEAYKQEKGLQVSQEKEKRRRGCHV